MHTVPSPISAARHLPAFPCSQATCCPVPSTPSPATLQVVAFTSSKKIAGLAKALPKTKATLKNVVYWGPAHEPSIQVGRRGVTGAQTGPWGAVGHGEGEHAGRAPPCKSGAGEGVGVGKAGAQWRERGAGWGGGLQVRPAERGSRASPGKDTGAQQQAGRPKAA